MDIKARLNKTQKVMEKVESKQNFNRLLFLCSLGIVIHSLTCLSPNKKLNGADYIGIPAFAVSIKNGLSLRKKEEKGQKIWHSLQTKSALQY